MSYLHAKQLVWSVDGKRIIDEISLDVDHAETVGIVGPNGAGKTSFLKCLYQENLPEQGSVTLSNAPLAHIDRRELAQKIAVVSQHQDAVFNLTVLDVVQMGLIPYKSYFSLNNQADNKLIDDAIAHVDLLNKKHQIFNTLSGGEQQRCLIARAIVQRPNVLIMDEPTNHLDIFYQHQILSIVKRLELTLVMTIHDLNLAAQYCDRIMLMAEGKVLAFDTPDKVLNSTLLSQVFHLDCLVDENPLTKKLRVTFGGAE